jgi:PAS domain S-box-containing protein
VVAGAFKYGLYQYLLKPDGFEDIVAVVHAAFESKQREAAYELMASIVNSIPDGVHSVDASGVITAMNPSPRQIYGYPDAEIVGRTFEILLPPRIRDQVRRLHDQALCGEIVQRFPTVQVRSDGSEIAVAMTIIPVRGIDGAPTCVAFIATPMPDSTLVSSEPTPHQAKQVARLDSPTDH